jgi:hypothetical protein
VVILLGARRRGRSGGFACACAVLGEAVGAATGASVGAAMGVVEGAEVRVVQVRGWESLGAAVGEAQGGAAMWAKRLVRVRVRVRVGRACAWGARSAARGSSMAAVTVGWHSWVGLAAESIIWV